MTQHKATPELYRQIFEVDVRGQALLEDLVARFSSGAVLPRGESPGTPAIGGIEAVLHTYHRQGGQAVVQYILNQVNRANGASPLGEDSDSNEVSFDGR